MACLHVVHSQISIHAPPRGATEDEKKALEDIKFQFTPLREGRLEKTGIRLDFDISIHAPPRGATRRKSACTRAEVFQFTPLREGRRGAMQTYCCDITNFNSRPSARGDGASRRGQPGRCSFQFTPLREGRLDVKPTATIPDISIHAPPRGATKATKDKKTTRPFQFTPLREGRHFLIKPDKSHTQDFNSRPSARGDLLWLSDNVCPANFNSRPSARGDRTAALHAAIAALFQFTPLREGRRVAASCPSLWHHEFQFTPLREGRLSLLHKTHDSALFQFTPLREGRPDVRLPGFSGDFISIHAPPRGATACSDSDCWISSISIHAPPRGATGCEREETAAGKISIHAPPRGATRANEDADADSRTISIHAPPRGATGDWQSRARQHYISIHAPPRGATCDCGGGGKSRCISIHAPPRGATRGVILVGRELVAFQFTPLREGRLGDGLLRAGRAGCISIHAPPRGATFPASGGPGVGKISIHAPPRGATRNSSAATRPPSFQFTPLREGRPAACGGFRHPGGYFNSRPSARGDAGSQSFQSAPILFQFTPLREGRPDTAFSCTALPAISIHAPPRGATKFKGGWA